MWESFKTFIHDISDWLEAIGFIVGIVTVIKVFFINKDVKKAEDKHLFQVRVDEHLQDIKNSSKTLSNLLSNFKGNIKDIKLELSKCTEYCKSLQRKVGKNDLKNLSPLINSMTKIKDNSIDLNTNLNIWQKLTRQNSIQESQIDNVYILMNALITELENLNNDINKSIK